MQLLEEVRDHCRTVAERARFVSIDLSVARTPEAVAPEAVPPGDADQLLQLDAINFGSGWFPTLRKRPGLSGYLTVASSLADFWRSSGGWSVEELRALRA